MKTVERQEAEVLRKVHGLSYNEIAEKLNVSKGTLSVWLRGVELSPIHQQKIAAKHRWASIEAGMKMHDIWEQKRVEVYESYDPPLTDFEFMLGVGLYWGEGNKADGASRSSFGIANSDHHVCIQFLNWARRYFECDEFDVAVHHYNADKDSDVKQAWSNWLDLPLNCFRKSQLKVSRTSQRKRPDLFYGTAHVRAKKAWAARVKIDKAIEQIKAHSNTG